MFILLGMNIKKKIYGLSSVVREKLNLTIMYSHVTSLEIDVRLLTVHSECSIRLMEVVLWQFFII